MADIFHSEIGKHPSDWSIRRVDSLFDIQQGKSVSKAHRVGENQKPFLRTKNVYWGKIDLSELDQMHFTEQEEARLKLEEGDLLLCEGGDVGRTSIWNNQMDGCYYQNHLHRLRAKSLDEIDPYFALHWFWYAFEIANLYIGRSNITTIPNLSQSKLSELQIPKPEINEQRRIAHVLTTVQIAIEQQARLIALTRELKSVLMKKLFTEGLRGEKQKETEIGLVPARWETTTLGELAKPNGLIQTGPFGSQLHKSDYQDDGIPVVNPTNMLGNKINHKNLPRISAETANGLKKHILKTGDIVFGRRGEIGRHGLVTEHENGWFCGTGSFLVRVNNQNIDNRFLSYYFSLPQVVAWLNSHAAGAIMPNLSNTVLGIMPVFHPSYDDQVDIANSLDSLSRKIELHESKHLLLEELFRALLHQLMTGQVRVNEIDITGLRDL